MPICRITPTLIDQAKARSRQMARKLKSVEALPSETAQRLLGKEPDLLSDEEG